MLFLYFKRLPIAGFEPGSSGKYYVGTTPLSTEPRFFAVCEVGHKRPFL